VVTVQADRPKVIKSGFTKDLRTIWFQFDQNVEGVDSCTDIFTSITLTQIGYGIIFVLIKIGIIDRLTIILYIGSFFFIYRRCLLVLDRSFNGTRWKCKNN